ncbi:iron-sulfur cluster assembly scaffold protein [Desulfonema ishimotonii]|uniref:Iron-sulfur cluster assembly scaffold protein n=1 Tax=Desulfonema ishimotonii TaxID=45657 RepID=A0A401G221_9BACT|nr:iron-sulfur cluster assembly scaffold protein [Desulfonema ishimotonii]GBC63246.1 iron-sulfur cluster assembly scaffold protein [Desulfonema ishimotonii]
MEKSENSGEEKFDFWQEHSLKYLEMAFRTDKQHRMEQPDGYGKKTGDCGDTIEMFLRIRDERVKEVSFEVQGCMNTNACSNAIAMLAEGNTVEAAWEITPEAVADWLESLPADHFHCAELAVGTFYLALTDYQKMSGNSWKRLYR